MRRPLVPAGWFIRYSKQNRFSLPNKIRKCKLKPLELVIFSYLCYYHNNYSDELLTPEMIAKGTHLTANTVKKYLSALISKGLITSENFLSPKFQCSNGENFFSLPNEIFLLELPPSAFMVYAYLLLIEDRKTHICHPSYNTIAAETGMSKNTALKSIGNLLEAGLIAVEPSSYFDKHGMKWKGNNRGPKHCCGPFVAERRRSGVERVPENRRNCGGRKKSRIKPWRLTPPRQSQLPAVRTVSGGRR